jgi:hypothetical protein
MQKQGIKIINQKRLILFTLIHHPLLKKPQIIIKIMTNKILPLQILNKKKIAKVKVII